MEALWGVRTGHFRGLYVPGERTLDYYYYYYSRVFDVI
jgi:hypothetical protein